MSLSLTDRIVICLLFYCEDEATDVIYTLSLHDALPIFEVDSGKNLEVTLQMVAQRADTLTQPPVDRKSTRLNSSHPSISYAVFCLKKKNIELIKPNSIT